MNVPNILTLIRILLTPLFVILLLKDMFPMALLVFAIAGISDGLDGFIARYFNQRTTLGAYLDPAADKLLLASSFVALAVLDIIPSWLAVIVIARDVIIVMGISILTLFQKPYEVRPSLISKLTTTCQIITVLATLFDPQKARLAPVANYLYWVTATVTIISGLHYIFIGMNILQDPSSEDGKDAGSQDR